MSDLSRDEFEALLKKSKAIDSKTLRGWLRDRQDASTLELADQLVQDELLTAWQAKFLLSGRHRLKIGNYRLMERIRKDEFGHRFLAVHPSLGRKVELQIFSSELSRDESRWKPLIEKTGRVANLDHPALVHVYDVDQESESYFLVVEHVPGQRLSTQQSMGLRETEIAPIVLEAAEGLQYAHQQGVVHGSLEATDLILTADRNIKIQNITLDTLRRPQQETDSVNPSDDFRALAEIGLGLLQANQGGAPALHRDSLVDLLGRLRAADATAITELKAWCRQHPRPSIAAVPPVDARTMDDHLGDAEERGPQETAGGLASHSTRWIAAALVVVLMLTMGAGYWVINSGASQTAQPAGPDKSTDGASTRTTPGQDDNDSQAIAKKIQQQIPETDSNLDRPRNPRGKPAGQPPGLRNGGRNPQQGNAGNSVAPGNAKPEKTEPEIPVAKKKTPDNLQRIRGIAEKREAALNKQGITTFEQMARMTPKDLYLVWRKARQWGLKQADCAEMIQQAEEFSKPEYEVTVVVNPADKLAQPPAVASVDDANSKQPAPGKPTLAEPFNGFPRQTKLPALDDVQEIKIANLVIRNQYLLGLDLISPEGIYRNRLTFESRRSEEDKQLWYVGLRRSPKQKVIDVAQFRKSEDAIYFRWLPEADKQKLAEFLQNCFVKLRTPDGQSTVCSLRRPMKVPPLVLDPQRLVASVEFEIPAFPELNRLQIDLERLQQGETELEIGVPRITAETPARIYLREKENSKGFMWVQVGADPRAKMELLANVAYAMPGSPGQRGLVNHASMIDQFFQAIRVDLRRATAAFNQSPNSKDKRLARDRAQDKLELMQTYAKSLRRLINGQPIHFRVVADFDGYQAVLAQSDAKMLPGNED